MDAEQLRSTYNKYFSVDKNKWSSTDKEKTLKVAERTLKWLRKLGFKNQSPCLLDVGCATGFYSEAFRLLGFKVTGLDYSEIAVEKAKGGFPSCTFVQMNGFDPGFNEKFDVIFCRGFSGTNTHDLNFIAGWINKYARLINENGFFILAYSSDFSGKETEGETVNHSREELGNLVNMVNLTYRGMYLFYYFGFLSRLKKRIQKTMRAGTKDYYYLFFQK